MRFGINPTIQTTGRSTDMAITAHDIVSDTPTNNFAALNPLFNSSISLSDGNLTTGTFLATAGIVTSSMQMLPNAITYFEIYYETSYSNFLNIGLMDDSNNSWGIRGDGERWNNGVQTAFSISFTTGNVLGVIVDIQNSKWYLAKNGALQLSANISNGTGYIHNNLTSNLSLRCWNASGSGSQKIRVNFGQDPTFGGATNLPTGAGDYDTDAAGNSTGGRFAFQPPTGALALCTANLQEMTPDVADDVPQDYFKTVLYTGNAGNQSITGVGFQPDLVWIKARSLSASNVVHDTVRGGNLRLTVDNNASESQNLNWDSFDSDGFTLSGNGANYNTSGGTYVAWCWKAGGAPTADNSNTSGAMTANSVSLNGILQSNYTPAGSPTIYPTRMSINTDAGFSIVSYTGNGTAGATVGHGLSSAPEMVITKTRNAVDEWMVGHTGLSSWDYYLQGLNTTDAQDNYNNVWNDTAPNASVFTLGTNGGSNGSGNTIIAYCWHSVEGYSKFGSYTGNGSADGPFVYTKFRPAFVMIKRTDTTGSWEILDSKRGESNPVNKYLYADVTDAEATYPNTDFLSNGFKLRNTAVGNNVSGGTFIFMAFAEQPFKYANAR